MLNRNGRKPDEEYSFMRVRILGVIAMASLLAACGTAQQTKQGSDASGSSSSAAGTSGSSSSSVGQTSGANSAPPVKAGSQEDLVVNVGDRVFFEVDKHTLNGMGRATLEKQAAWMKKHKALVVAIEGHCDERGTREYNLALGERRANAAKDYLISLGVSAGRVKTVSYGKERPVALGQSESSWSQNRRAVTIVSGAGS